MALNYPGGYITKSPPTPTSTSAPGIWTMDQALQYIKAGTWPTPPIGDQYFQYTNLLLGTGSTNGAQNNTFLDSSSNNFTITRNGNTTQGSFTPFSQEAGYWSNYFNGSSFISTPYNSVFAMNTYATFECWVNFGALSSDRLIFGKDGFWISYSYTGIGVTANKFGFGIYNGSSWTAVSSTTSPTVGQWYHVVGVRDNTTLRIYINGIQEATTAFSSSPVVSSFDLCVGANTGTQSPITGYVSNARYCNGATSGALPYTANFTPPTTPLTATASTVFLSCQSNRFVDNSANAFAITATGSPSVVPFQPFGAPTSPYSTTNVGGSGYFDGSGDALLINDSSQFTLGTNNFTVEAWVYPTTTGVQRIISGQSNSAASGSTISYWLDINSSNQPRILIWSGGTDYTATSSVAVSANQWIHLAGVRNGNTLTIYVNGTSTGTVSVTGVTVNDSTNQVGIGQLGEHTNVPWSGFISSFRLVNGTAVYTSNFTPPTAPLTAITNTALLTNFTNAAIFDNAAKNDMETVGNAQVSTSVTKFGNSAYFDGAGDYLSGLMNANLVFGSGDMTIECWVYPNTISGIDTIFDTRTSGSFGNESFLLQLNGGVPQVWAGSYSASVPLIEGTAISTATWTYIAFSRTSGVNKLFVNGNQVASNTNSWTQTLVTTNYYYIGQTVGVDRPFDGYISNLRITKGVGRYTYNFTSPTQAFGTIYAAPVTPAADPYFEYTTLLLPGSGTNGAQNNTFLDSSSNTFSITRNGNTTQGTFSPFSQTGWSNYFDGTGDYLSVPDNAAFDLGNGAFTLEAWIYPNDVTPSKAEWILSQWQSDSQNSWGFRIETSGALYFYYSADGNNATVFGADSPGIGERQWNHIAVVRNSNTVTIYVNGSAVSSATVTATFFNSSASVMVGNQANTGLGQTFTGYISNARVVKGTAVYTAAFTPPTSALTAISGTSLLTCQSNRFVDNSANAFAITVNGNTSVQAFSPFAPTAAYSAATNGGSGYFDGTGDFLSVPANAAFNYGTGDFTVEAWVYVLTVSNNASLILNSSYSGANGDWIIRIGAAGVLTGKWEFSTWFGGANYSAYSNAAPTPNAWTHIAAVRNGNTLTLYINGVAQTATATNTNSVGFSNQTTLICGDNSSGILLNAYVSSLRVVKGTAVYTSNFTPPTAPLTAITNTSLLTNFTNAGITDATAKNVAETLADAQISNTTAKWGSTSIKFDGTGDGLTVPDSPLVRLGADDFTIEFWFYPSALTGYVLGKGDAATVAGSAISFQVNVAWDFYYGSSFISVTSPTFTTGSWQHCAVTRYGPTIRIFKDGNLVGSGTISTNTINTGGTNPLSIGRYAGSSSNGYIQDFRLTKGIARYTQNFTPPTAAFQLL